MWEQEFQLQCQKFLNVQSDIDILFNYVDTLKEQQTQQSTLEAGWDADR